MKELKTLAKETAIYGISSIVGKFLNWCLVPLYSYVLVNSADYGIVTNLYAWTALIVIILTYGMETGFFRFANKNPEDEQKTNRVYSTTLTCLGTTSALFAILCVIFCEPIANAMGYGTHSEFILMLGIVVSMDAFDSIPFSYLRYKNKPITFAVLKLVMIFTNILFNIFFLIICPKIYVHSPELIDWFYRPDYGVGYIFVANLISTTTVTLALIPYIFASKYNFDFHVLKQMLKYSLPLVILGIAGIMNQTIDKILFPIIYPDKIEGMRLLGIYGACFKIAMIMMMFTYAFRFAYEPFIFAKNRQSNSKEMYADAMKYYILSTLIIFLGMTFYVDIFKLFLGPEYREGIKVVPIVLISYFFQGVFYNLSLWYKLIDKTMYGAYFSLIGLVVTVVLDVAFIPKFGYMAAAWSSLVCYFIITIISYFVGQKHYAIQYDLRTIGSYFFVAIALYLLTLTFHSERVWIDYTIKTILLISYVSWAIFNDKQLRNIPLIRQTINKLKKIKK